MPMAVRSPQTHNSVSKAISTTMGSKVDVRLPKMLDE